MNLYTSLFPNSRIKMLKKWGEGSHMPSDQVMMGVIEINGLTLHLFDAGPHSRGLTRSRVEPVSGSAYSRLSSHTYS